MNRLDAAVLDACTRLILKEWLPWQMNAKTIPVSVIMRVRERYRQWQRQPEGIIIMIEDKIIVQLTQ